MLGVVGDSAAGKTTLTQGLAALLGLKEATLICTDDYHKYDRRTRRTLKVTALHPHSNYLDIVSQHLHLLRQGQPILKPVYDHEHGAFAPAEYITPGQLVIVEGLLALHSPAMQKCFDVTIYLSPQEELRRQWKVNRDTAERNYTVEEVLASIERRLPDSQAYIWPQRQAADLVIKFYRPPQPSADDQTQLSVRVMQVHTLPSPDLSDILAQFTNSGKPGVRLEKDVWVGNRAVDVLEIAGDISPDRARAIEELLWRHLELSGHLRPEIIGGYAEGAKQHRSPTLALTQLLIAYYLVTVRAHQPLS
jgi:phosphoribulokinase